VQVWVGVRDWRVAAEEVCVVHVDWSESRDLPGKLL
jgi:hypothetical protein